MTDTAVALRTLWQLLDAQSWDALPTVLDEQVQVTYLHSGETFDLAAFIEFNRGYPGRWHCTVEELRAEGERAIARVRITGGGETYWVASFATVRDARIVELTEIWTDAVAPHPDRG